MNTNGRPNYNASTSLNTTQLQNYTAPSNGYVWGWVRCADNQKIMLQINDIQKEQPISNGEYMRMSLLFFFVVSAGDNIKFTGGAITDNLTQGFFSPDIS